MSDDVFDKKLRALDDVNVPDQWNDITSRSNGPVVRPLEPHEDHHRGRLLVAAAVVLLVVIGTGLLLAGRSDDAADVAIGEDPATWTTDPPEAMWGRAWLLESLTTPVDPGRLPQGITGVDGPAWQSGLSVTLDLTNPGQVRSGVCNPSTVSGQIFEGALRLGPPGVSTLVGCRDEIHALDAALGELLRSRPIIEVRGDHLALDAGESRATFRAADASGRPVLDRPDGIWGRRWVVDQITTTDGDVPLDRDVMLDLRVRGAAAYEGCNSVHDSEASLDGDHLIVVGGMTTMADCTGTVDGPVLRALALGMTVELRGDLLTLTGDDVVIELADQTWVAKRDVPDRIWGRAWRVDSVRTGTGDLVVPTGVPLGIGLHEQGTLVMGSCQIVETPASIERDRLFALTMEMSDQPDPPGCGNEEVREAVEREVVATLRGGPTIDLQGDRLTLTLGATVIRLSEER